ncbi:methanethiol S-methyltransferase [Catellatospora methionotrophica]|uniref:methanethiol S-methyltransferase n=1 Tax=Catellatospora methionotrophica TaxID=121620 RepID=UPI0033E239C5
MLRRILAVGYGVLAYAAFLAAIVYTIGFLANFAVPKGVDDGVTGAVWLAVAIDAGLLGVFAVQHSVMARPWFKRWWTRFVPAAVERSTFVLLSSLAVGLLLWQWRPLTAQVWSVEAMWLRVLLWTVCGLGWALLVLSTFVIGHFDLFGLRQVLARARDTAYAEPGFRQPLLYRIVRHPIMVGFIVAFWATPDMTAGHLLFAAAGTGYILIGVRFEEHDLRKSLGEPYERYARQVPGFIPRVRAAAERAEV